MRRLAWVAWLLVGCDDHVIGASVAITEPGFCGVEQVLAASCQNAGCHGAGAAAVGLDLETDAYSLLVGPTSPIYGDPYVVPGDAAGSFLYQKIAGTQGSAGGRMPLAGALPDTAIDHVGAWIDDGATPCPESR